MMRTLIATLLFCPILLLAQKPFINSISPTHVEVGQTVTIAGSNLSGSTNVYFGGVAASFTEISDNLLEATVPSGATNNSIYVINGGNIAQSGSRFFISFSGSDIDNYDGEFTQNTGVQAASDLCMCDLNGDGKNDIVIIHNLQSSGSELTIYLNNTSGTGAFSGSDFQVSQTLDVSTNNSGFFSVACGDLNNDGDLDLAFTSNVGTNSADVFVLAGNGTGSFSATPTSTEILPNTSVGDQRLPGSIEVADLNGDGLLDLVVGNRTDGNVYILKNNGGFTFDDDGNAVEIATTDESAGLIKVADFNNDGYQDIVTLAFRESNTSIHLFKNTSSTNTFGFTFQQSITNGGQTSDVEAGDLNNDGLLDLVVTSRNSGRITSFRNQSSGNSISFGSGANLTTSGTSSFGVNLGDMNGDGLLDIISSYAGGNIYVFENTSSGSLSFGTEEILSTSGSSTQNVIIGDLNGDAKPDIAYTRDVQPTEVGNLGIILNRNCVIPVLTPSPSDGGVFCQSTETFVLTTTESPGATYNWTVSGNTNLEPEGNSFTSNADNFATFRMQDATTATIRVTIIQDGACTPDTFDEQVYTINSSVTGGLGGPSIDVSNPGILCAGDAVTLTTSGTGSPYENHFWTLPDGSTSTASSIILDPVSIADAGVYTVRVQNSGSCSSVEAMQTIEVSDVPEFEVLNTGGDDFCASSTVTLEVPDYPSDYSYQWRRNGANIGGATNASYTTGQSGNYSVIITELSPEACTFTTSNYGISTVSAPASSINGPAETCVAFETSFTSASTGQSGFTLQYEWVVEDASDVVIHTATTQDLDFTFPNTGNFEVILNTNYDPTEVYAGPNPGDICVTSDPIAVTVSPEPTITFNVADGVEKCQAETINIQLDSPPAANISTYTWMIRNAASAPNDTIIAGNFSSNAAIDLPTPIGVDSVYAIVSITTTIGCEVKDSVMVRNFPSDVDISSPDQDASSDEITLDEANFIRLSADNVTAVSWSSDAPDPEAIFDDPIAIDVTVFPNQPRTTITVTGTDDNGCTVSSQVIIILDNLRPKKTFSPNGDAINDCWEILNSSQPNTQGCKVYIFDSRGRNIKVADAPFANNCVWDGNSNGSPVPEGVYYFVLKCSDDQMSKSGSILLAR